MAHDLKCYLCWKNETSDNHYYCYDCIQVLKRHLDLNINFVKNVQYADHCVSCGQFENRKIILMNEVVLICEICIMSELSDYDNNR